MKEVKKLIIIVLSFSVILGVAFWWIGSNLNKPKEKTGPINLTYWSIGEDESIFRPIIQSYEASHPNVKITYVKQSLLNYRTRLQTQLRAGQGPDVFRVHSSWVPMFLSDLTPAPESIFSIGDFSKIFYPVAKDTLTLSGKVYAVPIEIDGLALYYNEDILKAASIGVPKNWQEFVNFSRKVTVKNQEGHIETAGAALGTTSNVDFWPEIIGLLFLQQPDTSLATPANAGGAEVLQFYTSFITDPRNKTWDTTLSSSSQMFADGKLAFYFAPVSKVAAISAANPNLRFKTALVPQLPQKSISWGGFWAQGVSSRSPNQKEAWEFVKYLESPEILQAIYQGQTQSQTFGKPFPRIDMAGLLASDPMLGAFVTQGSSYKSWYLNSYTQDGGINDEMILLYSQAVDGVLAGQNSLDVLQAAERGIKPILDKYIKAPVPTIKR